MSANGGMFWFRPQALRPITEREWDWTDFPDESGWNDGGLAHVIERLYAYAALNERFYVRCVLNADWAEINYAFLEYRLQRLGALLPAHLDEQLHTLTQARSMTPLHALKTSVSSTHPRLGAALRPGYAVVRRVARSTRPAG